MPPETRPDRPPQPPAAPRSAPHAASPTAFENPDLGPTTKTEILAYVEGKIKAPLHLPQIEGNTLENKADRVLVVHCDYRDLYFQHGTAEVTKLAKEKLKALFKLATEGVLQAARNRTAAVQEKAPQELVLEESATLKEETKITIIPTGMIEMVKPGDATKLLDNGRIYKINGEDQVKCEITRQAEPKGPYTGFVKASAFNKAPTSKPLTGEEEAAAKPAAGAEATGNGKVLEFNEENFEAEVLKSDKPVIVDFYAPWCGPCKTMEPIMANLAKRHAANVKIGRLNTDENQKLANQYKISGIPCLIVFKNGQVVNRMEGAFPENVVEQTLIYNHPGPATALPSGTGAGVDGKKISTYIEVLARFHEKTGATIEEKDDKIFIKFKDGTTGEIVESADKNKLTMKISGKIGVILLTAEANRADKLFTLKMSKEGTGDICEASMGNKDLKISGFVYNKTTAIVAEDEQAFIKLLQEHHPELEAFFKGLLPEKPPKPPAQQTPATLQPIAETLPPGKTAPSRKPPAKPAAPALAPAPEPEPKPQPSPAPASPSEAPTAALQQSIEKVVENMKGTVAVYVFNPDTGQCLARLNENKVLPAASLIKVQILFALHEAVEQGIVLKEDFPMLKMHAEKMIAISDNSSTNVIIEKLGMEWINAFTKKLGFKDTQLNRLMSGDSPLQNWTTAAEMGKAMTMALTLTPPPGWPSALDLMLKSKRGERLGALLPESVQIARKSGELPRHTHNAYIFISGEKRIVTIVMVSDSYNKDLAKTGTAQIGKLAYDTMSGASFTPQPALAIPQQPAPAAEPNPEPAETLDANLNEILTSLRFENIAKLDLTKLDQSFNALKQAVDSGKLKIEKIIESIFPQEREKAIAIIFSDRFRKKTVGSTAKEIQQDPRSGAYFQKWEKLIAAVNTTGQHRLTHLKIWQKFLETFSTDTNKNKHSFVLNNTNATSIKPDRDLSRSHQEAFDIFFKASFIKNEGAFETGPEITAYEGGIVIAAAGDFKYTGTGNETPSGSHKPSPQAKAAYVGGGFSTPLSGNGLAILTYSGEVNYYSHLRSIVVKQGQIIEAGQILGKGGNTGVHAISQGKERGKHLHFQMHTINYDADLITAHPPEYIRAKLLEVK